MEKKNWKTYLYRTVMGIVFVILLVYALTLIYPFLWTFINSLKDNAEFYDDSFGLPKTWRFSNYIEIMDYLRVAKSNPLYYASFLEMFFNSIWYTAGVAGLGVLSSAMVGYALAKYTFPGRNLLYAIAIFVMLIPIVGSLPALYRFIYNAGLNNSPLYLVTATGGLGFNFIILFGFFRNVSWSYAEAAFVDGASNWTVFLRIMLPQAMSSIFSLIIIASIGAWNDYLSPLMFLPDFPTVTSGLFSFSVAGAVRSKPLYFAGILVSMLPIFLLFVIFQNSIMDNVVAGGLKG